jgi:hypothetical protein
MLSVRGVCGIFKGNNVNSNSEIVNSNKLIVNSNK